MMRVDICASDDHDTRDRLLSAIHELSGAHEGNWESLGVGLNRFRFPGGELSLFIDAWFVDVAGPDELVTRVLVEMERADYR